MISDLFLCIFTGSKTPTNWSGRIQQTDSQGASSNLLAFKTPLRAPAGSSTQTQSGVTPTVGISKPKPLGSLYSNLLERRQPPDGHEYPETTHINGDSSNSKETTNFTTSPKDSGLKSVRSPTSPPPPISPRPGHVTSPQNYGVTQPGMSTFYPAVKSPTSPTSPRQPTSPWQPTSPRSPNKMEDFGFDAFPSHGDMNGGPPPLPSMGPPILPSSPPPPVPSNQPPVDSNVSSDPGDAPITMDLLGEIDAFLPKSLGSGTLNDSQDKSLSNLHSNQDNINPLGNQDSFHGNSDINMNGAYDKPDFLLDLNSVESSKNNSNGVTVETNNVTHSTTSNEVDHKVISYIEGIVTTAMTVVQESKSFDSSRMRPAGVPRLQLDNDTTR